MKKSAIIVAIVFMMIGFAAVSTTLIINGNAKVIENNDDFSVIFTAASLDGEDVYSTVVDDTKKAITFTSKDLMKAGDTSILTYEITNNSANYDAEVRVTCVPKDGTTAKYTSIKNELEGNATKVLAKESVNGTLTITLSKQSTEEVSEEYTCKLEFNAVERDEVGYNGPTEWTFDYTGSEQTFTAPMSGTYKLETWGAQGGYAQTSEALGGYGGYSKGIVTLNKNDMLYIIVGGKGTDGDDYSTVKIYNGGYNGGGNAKSDGKTVWGAGGGATSIQNLLIDDGQLKNYSNNIENVLIVSGGGGGAGWFYKAYISTPKSPYNPHSGGSSGGYLGSNGISESSSLAIGGSQIKYGTNGNTTLTIPNAGFGYGGNYGETQYASGGGSGLYGGGGAYYNGSSGAGGSGYIGNTLLTKKVMYCYNCAESSEESTKTISTTCTSATPTENCSKQGNGYARITLIKQ